ncbi:hypothetical protein D3C73_902770 [compost metagenome]
MSAERVLIYSNHLRIHQRSPGICGHTGEIVPGNQRRSHNRPHGKVGAVFGIRHSLPKHSACSIIAYHQHIGIIPPARSGKVGERIVLIDNPGHPLPEIKDIICSTPHISCGRAPYPRFVDTPVADTEQDIAPGVQKRIPDQRIPRLRVHPSVITPVHLHIVHIPGGECKSILNLVVVHPWPSCTGGITCVCIQPEQQTLAVNIIRKRLHPAGEFDRIGQNSAVRIAAGLPAVVNHDIFIAGILHSRADQQISRFLNLVLIHIASVIVPAVPAHRRCLCQTVV